MNEAMVDVNPLHALTRNLDFILRNKSAKAVGIVSELPGEGKTSFLHSIAPLLGQLYGRKVLVLDCQTQEADAPHLNGVDYVSIHQMAPLKSMGIAEKMVAVRTVFREIENDYDTILIDLTVPMQMHNVMIPEIPMDGVIMVRSHEGIKNGRKGMTDLLLDRRLPVLGMVLNEGVL